ncbi:MAG: AMP-binding protein, partial [Gammaproteobacteria bacterium]|nr:AMP-binding protein [Gammaproteobacteria bacterium]
MDTTSGRRVSFGELDARVRRLANGLCDQNLEKGARVGVLAKNSIEYFEVYFACARAGLIAQPLNWRLGVPELARILEDGSPSVLVTSDEFHTEQQALQSLVDVPQWL